MIAELNGLNADGMLSCEVIIVVVVFVEVEIRNKKIFIGVGKVICHDNHTTYHVIWSSAAGSACLQ